MFDAILAPRSHDDRKRSARLAARAELRTTLQSPQELFYELKFEG